MKNKKIFTGLFAWIVLAFACANPLSTPAPGEEPSNVETVVAATFSALTASASQNPAALSTPVPVDSAPGLLPHSMYYLAKDAAQFTQVYRLERDGKTVTQITFEPASVGDYDVSLLDGSVVYISDNKMINVRADGSNRSVLFDGGAKDENNPFLTAVSSPVFSPDNQSIAFSHQGLSFYSVIAGQVNLVLKDDVKDLGDGLLVPYTLYRPELYSSDGGKLIVTQAHYEGASTAIYLTASGTLLKLNDNPGASICCGDFSLSSDGSSLFAGNPSIGMFPGGLWRVDTSNGNVTTLLSGNFESNPAELADNPFLAQDGQLYYFYASVPNSGDFINRSPLQLVRSAADGVTGRAVLRAETFQLMNEALWAPDASFVIVANAPDEQAYFGGAAQLYYTDGGQAMIPLVPYAASMKWGP